MSLIPMFAYIIVVLSASFLLALGFASLLAPSYAGRFLQSFAGTPAKHYTELALRFVVGAALLQHAPNMLFTRAFIVFGWLILLTTACLLLLPWHWHRRLAQRVVTGTRLFLILIGVGSLSLAAIIFYALIFH